MKLKKLLLLFTVLNLTACNNNTTNSNITANSKIIVYCYHRHGTTYPQTVLSCNGCAKIEGQSLEEYILSENNDGWYVTEYVVLNLSCGATHTHYLITYNK